jgi:hypothetical protein
MSMILLCAHYACFQLLLQQRKCGAFSIMVSPFFRANLRSWAIHTCANDQFRTLRMTSIIWSWRWAESLNCYDLEVFSAAITGGKSRSSSGSKVQYSATFFCLLPDFAELHPDLTEPSFSDSVGLLMGDDAEENDQPLLLQAAYPQKRVSVCGYAVASTTAALGDIQQCRGMKGCHIPSAYSDGTGLCASQATYWQVTDTECNWDLQQCYGAYYIFTELEIRVVLSRAGLFAAYFAAKVQAT